MTDNKETCRNPGQPTCPKFLEDGWYYTSPNGEVTGPFRTELDAHLNEDWWFA